MTENGFVSMSEERRIRMTLAPRTDEQMQWLIDSKTAPEPVKELARTMLAERKAAQ